MKYKKLLIIAIILICFTVLFAGCGLNGNYVLRDISSEIEDIDMKSGFNNASSDDDYAMIDETERLRLIANLKNGEIIILDKATGREWRSNPPDKDGDALASGFNRVYLYSQVLINYSTALGVTVNVGSYNGSVTRGGLTYKVDDGKVIFNYEFEREGLSVPVRYSLDGGEFVAEILTNGVGETSDNKIKRIEILPFLGYGGMEDEGFYLVPDGSGVIIYFNNGKTGAKTYELPLYGFDNGTNDKVISATQALRTSFTLSENGYLPVYGVNCNDEGFVAIVTKGAGRSTVYARVAGQYTSYNNIWTGYNYRMTGTVRLMQKEMTESVTSIGERKPETSINYEIRYVFLDKGAAGLADMAGAYRDHLIRAEGLTRRTVEGDIPFYLDLYGYIVKTKSFMGIPRDTKIVTTPISKAVELVDLLSPDIGNVVLKYNHWMKDGYYDKIQTGAKVEGKVGSRKELKSLQDRLSDMGGALYLSTDLVNIYKTGNKVSKFNNVLNSVANTPLMQNVFSLDTASVDARYDSWYLVRLLDLPGYMDVFLKNFTKNGYRNAAFESIGSMAYSDLSSRGLSRSRVPEVIGDALEKADEALDGIMISGANDFAAVKATHILDTSGKSSNYDIVDTNVPFYQMVFHGYAYYGIGATNLSSNPDDMLLKCLEYGASPTFSWVTDNFDELVGSRTNYLFSADYGKWLDYAVGHYKEINGILKDVSTLTITDYKRLAGNVYATTYGGAYTIVVNYNNYDVDIDGVKILAKGYITYGFQ